MSIDKKILAEIERYNRINNYIREQEAGLELPPPEAGAEPALPNAPATPSAEVSPIPPTTEPQPENMEPTPIDVTADDDVVKIDNSGESMETGEESEGDSGAEELEITDLVLTQQDIQTNQEKYFDKLFTQIDKLESKLSEIDTIMNRLDTLDTKLEKYREKTPEEKLELRSLDSYPFTQKLSQFFDDKSTDMAKSGKNEYVLTSDEVKDINPSQIKDTFAKFDPEEF